MKRRNFLRNFFLVIFAFTFGYTVKREANNMVLQRIDSGSVTEQIKFLNEQLADISINVKSKGVKGDGITDDTEAIQSVLDLAKSLESATIYLPKSTYIVSTLSLSSANNIRIVSNGATIKQNNSSEDGLISISSCNNIEISGLKLEGTNTAIKTKTGYEYHGIRINNCNFITIQDCEIYNMSSGGILATDSSYVKVMNNYLHGNLDMFDIAYGYAVPNVSLEGFWADKNICHSANRYGIYVQGYGKNINITDNHIKDKHEYGILIYRMDSVKIGGNVWENVIITDNIIENISDNPDTSLTYRSGMGIYLQTATKVVCNNNVLRNVLQNRKETPINRTLAPGAISIGGSREVTCVGNLIDGSGVDGIDIVNVEFESKGTTVADNTIIGIKQVGIYLNGGNNVGITGNVINGDNGKTGIIASSVTAINSTQIVISNNNITKGFNTGITIVKGSGTVINDVIVTNNLITDVLYQFINASDTNDLIIANNLLKALTKSPNTTSYGIVSSVCTNVNINGNVLVGTDTYKIGRGIGVTNSTNGLITNNIINKCADTFYALYTDGNTDVFIYSNKTDRQQLPMFGEHLIGNDTGSDTAIKVMYQTTIPNESVGYCAVGSICHNLSPVAGGSAGWICVSSGTPGTWKTFGTIQA
ncbi:right-handed parallel beta-helix repeat-containing protein [Bacillus sp. V3B]|uniref:right-handed parallel beta-helix repeat-containing protein n=1 Tax=Bacillus sp. V3B TaxID=2804915 RepID=UPI002108761E|nr:right-handed parallel beta-helix repeat-containing protein [Bacillus sp. V3B]MCQ6274681.1 right-handed parallel beta-helix repeat-containing protein [Bacillus sp. V3B]